MKMRQGRLLDMPATDRSPSGRRCRAIKPPGLVEDAEHLFQLSLRCTLVLRRWNPVIRPWRVHRSLARLATYSAVAADNGNNASRTASARPEESPTARCRGFRRRNASRTCTPYHLTGTCRNRQETAALFMQHARHYSASLVVTRLLNFRRRRYPCRRRTRPGPRARRLGRRPGSRCPAGRRG